MASVEPLSKNPDGTPAPGTRWRVRYRDVAGEAPKTIPCSSKSEGEDIIKRIDAWHALNAGQPYPRPTQGRIVPHSLGDVAVAWLRDRSRDVSPRTIDLYSAAIECFAKSLPNGLDGSPISDLNTDNVVAWDSERIRAEIGQSTRDIQIGAVLGLHGWAWKRRRCEDNPNGWIGVREVLLVERPGSKSPKPLAPTWDECHAVIARIDPDTYPMEHRRVVSHYYTGIRTFQVTGAFYADRLDGVPEHLITTILDVRNGTMRVIKGKTPAETAARRHVPLAPAFVEVLREWHARDPRASLVSGSQAGQVGRIGDAFEAATVDGKIRRATWGATIETGRGSDSTCHAFRRALTSGLKRAGGDVEGSEYYVGHAIEGVRASYLDPDSIDSQALVALIPPLPPRPEALPDNVITLVNRHGKKSGWIKGKTWTPRAATETAAK